MRVEIEFRKTVRNKGHNDLIVFADKLDYIDESGEYPNSTEITLSKDQNNFKTLEDNKMIECRVGNEGNITHLFYWNDDVKTLKIYN